MENVNANLSALRKRRIETVEKIKMQRYLIYIWKICICISAFFFLQTSDGDKFRWFIYYYMLFFLNFLSFWCTENLENVIKFYAAMLLSRKISRARKGKILLGNKFFFFFFKIGWIIFFFYSGFLSIVSR